MTTKFEIGKTYAARSICDHNCIFAFEILARTEKRVTVRVHGEIVARGVTVRDGVEQFMPFGRYSMAPTIRADKPKGESVHA